MKESIQKQYMIHIAITFVFAIALVIAVTSFANCSCLAASGSLPVYNEDKTQEFSLRQITYNSDKDLLGRTGENGYTKVFGVSKELYLNESAVLTVYCEGSSVNSKVTYGSSSFTLGTNVSGHTTTYTLEDGTYCREKTYNLSAGRTYYIFVYSTYGGGGTSTITTNACAHYKINHAYSDWEITTPVGCIEDGIQTRTCSVCFRKEQETLPALGYHQWGEEYVEDVPATCTSEGSQSFHCSVCDEIDEGSVQVIPKKQHEWENGYTVDEPPTCISKGSESIHCAVCGEKQEGSERTIEIIDEHQFGEWEIIEPATCTTEGTKKRVCEVCEFEEVEIIPAIGHSWNNPSYSWGAGYKTATAKRKCNNDDSHEEKETVDTTTTEENRKLVYIADFTNPAFKQQKKVIAGVPCAPLGSEKVVLAKDSEILCCEDDDPRIKSFSLNFAIAEPMAVMIRVRIYPNNDYYYGDSARYTITLKDGAGQELQKIKDKYVYRDTSQVDWYHSSTACYYKNWYCCKSIFLEPGVYSYTIKNNSDMELDVLGTVTGFNTVSSKAKMKKKVYKRSGNWVKIGTLKAGLPYIKGVKISKKKYVSKVKAGEDGNVYAWAKSKGTTTVSITLLNGKKYKTKVVVKPGDPNLWAYIDDYSTRNNYFVVRLKNKGPRAITIITSGSKAIDCDYKRFDRWLKSSGNIKIKPGKSRTIKFRVNGNNTWYDHRDFTILSKIKYEGRTYKWRVSSEDTEFKIGKKWRGTYWDQWYFETWAGLLDDYY